MLPSICKFISALQMALNGPFSLLIFLLIFAYVWGTEARIQPEIRRWSEQSSNAEKQNTRPLIGILSQPGDGDGHRFINKLPFDDPRRTNMSYIAASYVKFVEAGGARAVPLLYNEPEESLLSKFAAINGILFPGGGSSLNDGPFYRTAEKLFKMTLEANDKGDYFPLWGTCLGFELLSIIVSQNHSILEHFSAEQQPGPLTFVGDWAKDRNMFSWFPKDVLAQISNKSLAMENHVHGLSPVTWETNGPLSDFFQVLTVTKDKEGKEYVSTVEGRKYPVTGVQWHPEKNAFEWSINTIPHSSEAIQVTQSAANFFISEARKSSHMPSSIEEEENLLMYNYDPIFSGKDGDDFDQSYVLW